MERSERSAEAPVSDHPFRVPRTDVVNWWRGKELRDSPCTRLDFPSGFERCVLPPDLSVTLHFSYFYILPTFSGTSSLYIRLFVHRRLGRTLTMVLDCPSQRACPKFG